MKNDTNDNDNIPFEKNLLESVFDELNEEFSFIYGIGSYSLEVLA